jgi:hypothetical protein
LLPEGVVKLKKISIISPIFENVNRIPESMRGVVELFKDKYDFEVFYYYQGLLPKVDTDYRFNFIDVKDCKNFNECVTDGFARVTGDCVIVANLDDVDFKDFITKLVVEWEAKAQVVLVQKEKDNSFWGKVKNFFVKIGRKMYDILLSLFGLSSDFHAFRNFQLFSREVVEVINAFPEKNYYLRNFDCWVDYRVSVLYSNKKVKVKNGSKVLNRDFGFFLSSMILMICTILLITLGSAQVDVGAKSTFMLIGISLCVALGGFGLFSLFRWVVNLKTKIEVEYN